VTLLLALISPPEDRPDEVRTVQALFEAGLARYHLRKPGLGEAETLRWLESLPERFHPRVHLHAHHGLARRVRVGGIHFRSDNAAGADRAMPAAPALEVSRSCHTTHAVADGLGRFDALFFSPVFPSISKRGYGPTTPDDLDAVCALLRARPAHERRTRVFALGGMTPERVPQCVAWGFDGVAVLGAVWSAQDPLAVLAAFQVALAACTNGQSESNTSSIHWEGRP
jgi:thiamine-phosphate pyrophosphorylase